MSINTNVNRQTHGRTDGGTSSDSDYSADPKVVQLFLPVMTIYLSFPSKHMKFDIVKRSEKSHIRVSSSEVITNYLLTIRLLYTKLATAM